jgi:hypothetical protein
MTGKRWLVLGGFGLALVVNPYLACSSEGQSDFDYSEDEMKRAVLGTWQGTAELGGETIPFSLVLEQASSKSKTQGVHAPSAQPQCASRSFVKPAAACISQTTMPVIGTLTSVSPELNGAVDGTFAAGRNLSAVRLELSVDGGASLTGTVDDDALSDGHLSASSSGSFSLQRP